MDRRTLASALACAGALTACGHGSSATAGSSQIARVGQAAPTWTEPGIAGPAVSLSALRGKAVYLNFFATWCEPCNEEAPAIDSLARTLRGRGLEIVGVDVLENASKAATFRRRYHLGYPIVVDDGTLRDQYRINGLPVHVFIDRTGVVRKIVVGEMSPEQMRSNVERVLQ